MRPTRSLGFQLLGVWLIAHAVLAISPVLVPGIGVLMAILAFAAGLLILIGR